MNPPVIITGGAGFLGQLLVDRTLRDDPETSVVVLDRVESADQRVDSRIANVSEFKVAIGPLLDSGPCRIYHLASVVSSAAEQDWPGAMSTNVVDLIGLLETLAESPHRHQLIFASSVAVFGGDLASNGPGDHTKQTPSSTYGATKAIGELLVNDAYRRGFIDGRIARLPTVIVRPGKPNAAASSFCSGMFREPLAGIASKIPVKPQTSVVVIGAATAVECLAELADIEPTAFDETTDGASRAVSLPGLRVTVAEMADTLEEVAGASVASLISYEPDSAIESIVSGWPGDWDDSRARNMGLSADSSLTEILRTYLS